MSECSVSISWKIKNNTSFTKRKRKKQQYEWENSGFKNMFLKNTGCLCPHLYSCLLGGTSLLAPPPSTPTGLGGGPTWASTIWARHQFLRVPSLLVLLGITKTEITVRWRGSPFLLFTARHRWQQHLQYSQRYRVQFLQPILLTVPTHQQCSCGTITIESDEH